MISELYKNEVLRKEWNRYFEKELKSEYKQALHHFHHWLYKKYEELETKYTRAKELLTDDQLIQVEGD